MALHTSNIQTRRIIDEHARQAGASIKTVLEPNNIRTNIEMARDLGLATIASHHLCRLVDGVVELKIQNKMPIRKTSMIFRRRTHKTRLLQKFVSHAEQKVKG